MLRRLPKKYEEMSELLSLLIPCWIKHKELRFCQLVENIALLNKSVEDHCSFYISDEQFKENIKLFNLKTSVRAMVNTIPKQKGRKCHE